MKVTFSGNEIQEGSYSPKMEMYIRAKYGKQIETQRLRVSSKASTYVPSLPWKILQKHATRLYHSQQKYKIKRKMRNFICQHRKPS